MKNVAKMLFMLPLLLVACGKMNVEPVVDPVDYDGDFAFSQELTVPLGTRIVYIEYNDNTRTLEVPVSPELVKPDNGKNVEPFGVITLNLVSPVKTVFNAYYKINEMRVDLIDNGIVDQPVAGTKAASGTVLTEPREYSASDGCFTTYHSSGVVMFEDSWPTLMEVPAKYDRDFNDLIMDYDFEAVTVSDDQLANQGWREQIKVVLHVRATSASKDNGCETEVKTAGVILEGFNLDNVGEKKEGGKNIDTYCSLDSWQNPHGELPGWTVNTLQKNSRNFVKENLGPCVEIGSVKSLKEVASGAGTETYTRKKDAGDTFTTVFNPNVNGYWTEPKTEQYSAALEQLYDLYGYATLAEIQASGYYNVVPGYVNVSGGLYTYTVIYHIKDRAGLDAAARDEIKQNMINTVYQTTNQNFYVVTTEGVPVGLKGYTPYDIAAYQTAADAYSLASETDNVDPNVYYKSTKDEGYIWAFKCPTLTRHMWNKLPLSMAYPNYSLWLESNGANSQDWYTKDVDPRFLSCWW